MTELLEFVMQRARELPDERQDHLAREILQLLQADETVEITNPAHIVAIRTGLAQIQRGEFATDEEIEAVYRSFGK
jgi:predicted transcriptional regulator